MPHAKSLTYMNYEEPQLHSSDFVTIHSQSILQAINKLSQKGVVTTLYDKNMCPIESPLDYRSLEDFEPNSVPGVDYLINGSLAKIRNFFRPPIIKRDIELNSETIDGLKTLADFLDFPFDRNWVIGDK